MPGSTSISPNSINSSASGSLTAPFLSDEGGPKSSPHCSFPKAASLVRLGLHPITRNIVFPALKNIGGILAIAGAVTDLLGDSGPNAIWIGLTLIGVTTLVSSAMVFRTEYLGSHLAQSLGNAAGGLLFLTIDVCHAYTCPPYQRIHSPLQIRQRTASISDSITKGQPTPLTKERIVQQDGGLNNPASFEPV